MTESKQPRVGEGERSETEVGDSALQRTQNNAKGDQAFAVEP